MSQARLLILLIVFAAIIGCDTPSENKNPTSESGSADVEPVSVSDGGDQAKTTQAASPVGKWTIRHELKGPSGTPDEDKVVGFSTSTITIKKEGKFDERLEVDLIEEEDLEPTDYQGTWEQNGDVIRMQRDGDMATFSYVIDKEGLRMSGNVAGHDVVLTRSLEKQEPPKN